MSAVWSRLPRVREAAIGFLRGFLGMEHSGAGPAASAAGQPDSRTVRDALAARAENRRSCC